MIQFAFFIIIIISDLKRKLGKKSYFYLRLYASLEQRELMCKKLSLKS